MCHHQTGSGRTVVGLNGPVGINPQTAISGIRLIRNSSSTSERIVARGKVLFHIPDVQEFVIGDRGDPAIRLSRGAIQS